MIGFFDRHGTKIVIAWITILTVLYSALSVVRHTRFESGGFDLGLYDQAVWQYANLLWPYNTIKDRFILGDHLTLTLPLLAPLYLLWSDVRLLLIFQAFWISFSTFAVYKLARQRKLSGLTSSIIGFLYSLFYGIQYAIFFDFHPVVIGVGLIAWFLYFFEAKKQIPALVFALLLLLTQENMGLALAGFGCIYFFRKDFRKSAIILIVIGITVSLVASKIIALFSPIGFQYWPQISTLPIEILKQFFDSQEKRSVWFYSLSWFSFLPILSPGAMIATLLDLAQYFVTGPEFSRMWSPFMHHRITLAPLLTLGTLETLEFFKRKKINVDYVSVVLFAIALGLQFYFHLPLNKLSKSEYWNMEPWMADNRKLIATIPPEARLATQQDLIPHVSHRQHIYLAWPRQHDFDPSPCGQKSCWWLDFDKNTQFLLIDLHPNQWLTQTLETNEHFNEAINNMEKSGKISIDRSVNNAKFYKVNN